MRFAIALPFRFVGRRSARTPPAAAPLRCEGDSPRRASGTGGPAPARVAAAASASPARADQHGCVRLYRPGPYPGDATLFVAATREPGTCDPLPVWHEAVGGALTVVAIPGGHIDAIIEPNVGVLAARLSERLRDQT